MGSPYKMLHPHLFWGLDLVETRHSAKTILPLAVYYIYTHGYLFLTKFQHPIKISVSLKSKEHSRWRFPSSKKEKKTLYLQMYDLHINTSIHLIKPYLTYISICPREQEYPIHTPTLFNIFKHDLLNQSYPSKSKTSRLQSELNYKKEKINGKKPPLQCAFPSTLVGGAESQAALRVSLLQQD